MEPVVVRQKLIQVEKVVVEKNLREVKKSIDNLIGDATMLTSAGVDSTER